MARFLSVPVVVGISATLLAQNFDSSGRELVQSPASVQCTVMGRVVTAAEGNPLKAARVALRAEHSNQVYATASDSDGHFILKDIPPGLYQLFATKTGFVEQYYKARTNDSGPLFSLTPGAKISDVVFQLIAAAVITGRVSNEDGDPLPEVKVTAGSPPSDEEFEDEQSPASKAQMEPVASVRTDDRGQYRIFGLKPGQYYITVEDSFEPTSWLEGMNHDQDYWLVHSLGTEYGSVFYPGVTQISQAQALPIKPGEEVQADLVMRRVKTVEIAGHVIGATGPVARIIVYLEPADDDFDFHRNDTTDEKGSFRLRNVPQGTYYIHASQLDQSTSTSALRGRQKIEVIGDNIDSLTITLGAGTTIQGRVKVDGRNSTALDRLQLSLRSLGADEKWWGGSTNIKQDGSFAIQWVPDGTYAINVRGLDRGLCVKSVRRGSDDLLEKGLQVEGSSPEKVEVILSSRRAQLEGSVISNDRAMIGAEVRLAPDPLTPYNRSRIQRTTTDQMLHFSLTDIAPGKYKLTARAMLSPENAWFQSEPQSITLSDNDHKMIEIKLEKRQESEAR